MPDTRNTKLLKSGQTVRAPMGLRDEAPPKLLPAYATDDHELSASSVKKIRALARQDGYQPTRTLIVGL